MAIRGRLDELQASEVLQFLTQSGRSGTLRFQDGRRSKFLSFESGRLVFAVSQHQLPPLGQVLYQAGLTSGLEAVSEEAQRWDEEVTKALQTRRIGDNSRKQGDVTCARLGRILIGRGRITEEDLEKALDPTRMSNEVLEEILVAGGLSKTAIQEVHKSPSSSLYEAITKSGIVTPEQIQEAVACMSERNLAQLLVSCGYVKNSEATYCVEQIEALRGQPRPTFRIGEFLVASGRLNQRQLEKALGAQLTRHARLGEILVDQDLMTEEELRDAEHQLTTLRAEFSPLRALCEALVVDHDFTPQEFLAAREHHFESERTLAEILVETGKVAEADLRSKFEEIITDELSDLLIWQDGMYEFFEGFSLADAMGDDGMERVHGNSFEVNSILLDAHYRIDELRRTSFKDLGPHTILQALDLEEIRAQHGGVGVQPTPSDERLLERMNGQRSLSDVCAVLPGNLMSHCKVMMRFLDSRWVSPLTRDNAFKLGQTALTGDNAEQALVFFEHSMRTAGDEPKEAVIRMAIQDARLSQSRSFVKSGCFKVQKGIRLVANTVAVQNSMRWIGRFRFLRSAAHWLRARFARMRNRWSQTSMRMALAVQDFMIQKGLARQWWMVRRRLVDPIKGWGSMPAPKVLTSLVICATIGVALMIPGVTSIDPSDTGSETYTGSNSLRALRSPIKKLRVGARIDAAPEVTDKGMYISARDGVLRGIPLVGGESTEWKVQLGEYGDLLSSPTVYGDKLFVTNVRGTVHALTTQGRQLWTKTFPRVECIAPTVIPGSRYGSQAVGIVIVARESVFVLHPDDGRVMYHLQCGNVIEARPVVMQDQIFVGSADNHVYCSDWRTKQVLWDQELDEDVWSLTLVEDKLIALIRGGAVVCMRAADGEIIWRKKDETKPVRRVRDIGGGRISTEMAEGGLQIHDSNTGSYVSSVKPIANESAVRMLLARGTYFYYSERGDLGQVDETGEHIWRCRESLRGITNLVLRRDNLIVTNEEGGVWVFSLRDEEAEGALSDG